MTEKNELTDPAALDVMVAALRNWGFVTASNAADTIAALCEKIADLTVQRDELDFLLNEGGPESHAAWLRERDAAYARGVHDAPKALQSVADNWDCGHMESRLCNCRPLVEQWELAADEVRVLADAPPAPVVGVDHGTNEPPCDISGLCEVHADDEKSETQAAMCIHCGGWRYRNTPRYGNWGTDDQKAARIRAALLPQVEGGEG